MRSGIEIGERFETEHGAVRHGECHRGPDGLLRAAVDSPRPWPRSQQMQPPFLLAIIARCACVAGVMRCSCARFQSLPDYVRRLDWSER
jgi:hypothetical protein